MKKLPLKESPFILVVVTTIFWRTFSGKILRSFFRRSKVNVRIVRVVVVVVDVVCSK